MKSITKTITIQVSDEQTIVDLSKILQSYQADVLIKKVLNGNILEVNIKSFLGLITLRLQNNDRVEILAVGEDCEEALHKVVEYFT
ncbi:HPr family phosphocarrier protein [Halalkalibacterium halodurans]|uniref:Phosphocarrier HPr family protein n=1 Tax=Halalkalibacterium halodurans TaxID=86665 RepID=A0A0M0KDK5_ALKHA|nr:HPr family phosphocarrier protein [Halalkalibacterium halodurans]MDY7220916.1 HPr family phosphocarrier protein [Halalkalibacterium halodurans]MDY7240155.1 HPr family phosphocarrier protein [Halalkalibacterium halodurans]